MKKRPGLAHLKKLISEQVRGEYIVKSISSKILPECRLNRRRLLIGDVDVGRGLFAVQD